MVVLRSRRHTADANGSTTNTSANVGTAPSSAAPHLPPSTAVHTRAAAATAAAAAAAVERVKRGEQPLAQPGGGTGPSSANHAATGTTATASATGHGNTPAVAAVAPAFVRPPELRHLPHPLDAGMHQSALDPWSEDSCRDYILKVCARRLDELEPTLVRALWYETMGAHSGGTPGSSAGGGSGGSGASGGRWGTGGPPPPQPATVGSAGRRLAMGGDSSPVGGNETAAAAPESRQLQASPGGGGDLHATSGAVAGGPSPQAGSAAKEEDGPIPASAAAATIEADAARIVEAARKHIHAGRNTELVRLNVRLMSFYRLLMLCRPPPSESAVDAADMPPPDLAVQSAVGGNDDGDHHQPAAADDDTPAKQKTRAPGYATETTSLAAAATAGIPVVATRKEPLMIALRNVYFDLLRIPHPSTSKPAAATMQAQQQQAVPVVTPAAAAPATASGGDVAGPSSDGSGIAGRRRNKASAPDAAAVAPRPGRGPTRRQRSPVAVAAEEAAEPKDEANDAVVNHRRTRGRAARAESASLPPAAAAISAIAPPVSAPATPSKRTAPAPVAPLPPPPPEVVVGELLKPYMSTTATAAGAAHKLLAAADNFADVGPSSQSGGGGGPTSVGGLPLRMLGTPFGSGVEAAIYDMHCRFAWEAGVAAWRASFGAASSS